MLPDESIGYWLSYAHRSFSSAFSEVLRRHCAEQGKSYVITPAQWGILSFLVHMPEQTIGTLAQCLGIDAPAISNIVQRLEQSGLVERVRDREDQRIVKVLLSEEGQEIMHSLQPVFEAFNEQLLPVQERQTFIEELQRFVARTSTLVPESAGRFSLLRERLSTIGAKKVPERQGDLE